MFSVCYDKQFVDQDSKDCGFISNAKKSMNEEKSVQGCFVLQVKLGSWGYIMKLQLKRTR